MNSAGKRILLVAAAVLLCSAVCYPQEIATDFQEALAMVPQEPKWPSGIMYYDMQDAADMFVGKYTDSPPVEFLETKIQELHTRKLAFLCLAKFALLTETAQATFYDVLYGKFGTQAVTAIAYLEPGDGRPIAETLVSQPGPWEVRKAAVELLVGLGDHDTLEMFQQLIIHEEQGFVKKALESAVMPLKHRLTHVAPRKQADWAHWDTVCWRTFRETPLPRRVDGEKRLAAETLHMQGWRFPREYLEYKLASADLLGIVLIGLQKETWAVPGLKEYATLKGSLGDFSRSSLAKMGTSEALRALEDALIPGGYSRANTHLTMILEICGDRASAEFMKNLSADQRFSEDERASFEHAYKIIVKRLADINGDGAEDITLDFQQALAKVPEEPRWPSGIMYYDMQDAADTFVSKYADSPPIEFLETKIGSDIRPRKLALLSLAKLAATNMIAEQALRRQVYGSRWITRRDAVIAIAYLDRKNGRRIAETLLTQPGPWGARKRTIDILVGLGDRDTLEMLKQMQPVEENSNIKEALASAIAQLEHRLTEVPPHKREQWALQDTLCCRTLLESPLSRAPHTEDYVAAKTLYMQGIRLSRDYLEHKLTSGHILEIEIIGNQKEEWAVQGLRKHATERSALGDAARGALVKIGTGEGLRAIEDCLMPGLPSNVFNHLMSLLRLYGDGASAELMENLSADQRFSESERFSINITRRILRERIADINGDGDVDFDDFALIAVHWLGNNSY